MQIVCSRDNPTGLLISTNYDPNPTKMSLHDSSNPLFYEDPNTYHRMYILLTSSKFDNKIASSVYNAFNNNFKMVI
jgi:hypothetical protein